MAEQEQTEVATIEVGGGEYSDWETVWVQTNYADGFSQFRFTCAEKDAERSKQIKPGDECQIRLGNKLAITGVVLTRQVAADANSHGVQLSGVSLTWYAGRASVLHKTGRFDNKTFQEIAEEVLKPTGVKFEPIGKIPETKFVNVQVQPGEKIFDFLERLGREVKVIIAHDRDGKFLWVGEHDAKNVGTIKEGENLKSFQCVISDAATHSEYVTRAQCWATDKKKYREVAQQEARAPGSAKRYSPLYTPVEHPVWTDKEVEQRCNMEQMWHEGQDVQVTAVVQGWFTQSGELWTAGDDVSYNSPMSMINDTLKIQVVTFTQDVSSGSLTTLLLVTPWGLNGKRGASRGNIRGGVPLSPAKIDKGPPRSGGLKQR
jgi:prophage tail gpP-like protein